MRPPEKVGGSAQRALRHLRGAGAARAAADHLLKPAQGSSGRAGALGCGAAEPPGPFPRQWARRRPGCRPAPARPRRPLPLLRLRTCPSPALRRMRLESAPARRQVKPSRGQCPPCARRCRSVRVVQGPESAQHEVLVQTGSCSRRCLLRFAFIRKNGLNSVWYLLSSPVCIRSSIKLFLFCPCYKS